VAAGDSGYFSRWDGEKPHFQTYTLKKNGHARDGISSTYDLLAVCEVNHLEDSGAVIPHAGIYEGLSSKLMFITMAFNFKNKGKFT